MLYIVSIASTSRDSRAEAVLSIEKTYLVTHAFFEHILWQWWTLLWKSKKRNHQIQRALSFTKHTHKFTSLKLNLLVLQVKANKARDQGLLGSRCHNYRHQQHSCTSRASMLLTCREDYAQNHPSYFYHFKSHGLITSRHPENL